MDLMASKPLTVYKKWVMENPERATELETTLKWLTYFAAGKINNSMLVSELVFSGSNLFSLYNDILIGKSRGSAEPIEQDKNKERLKLWLTVLHYCEVFIEIGSRNRWGKRGKWSAAVVVQLIRCASNLVLIHKYGEVPVQQPPVPALRRSEPREPDADERPRSGFVLKRSGRTVRRIEAAPPVVLRDWQPPEPVRQNAPADGPDPADGRLAETLYAIKPLVHLAAVGCFGPESWTQWLTNLALDLASLRLHRGRTRAMTFDQRSEINRRQLSLVLYLLRSPVYRRHTSAVINRLLTGLSNNIPLARLICNPILEYIPSWQDTYFYMWAN